jgi:hypothetical protein
VSTGWKTMSSAIPAQPVAHRQFRAQAGYMMHSIEAYQNRRLETSRIPSRLRQQRTWVMELRET